MRIPVVAANWKMHGSVESIQAFLESLVDRFPSGESQVVVCPPFPLLPAAVLVASGSRVAIGAQNCHWENKGAFTGEVAPPLLRELGVAWVIVGHSERRQLFGERDETALKRAHAAQAAGLQVIFCVGETLEQRERDETLAVLERQTQGWQDLKPGLLTVAYEPVWAIGTGRTASPAQAQEAHAFLRRRLGEVMGPAAAGLRLLYGGSVKPDNAAELLGQLDVDGALVGGASLDVDSFSAIIRGAGGPG